MKKISNPCIRCGKERIVAKKWDQYEGTSLVSYINTVCPDPDCQKIVEAGLKDKKDHLAQLQAKSLERRTQNRRNLKKS